MEPEQGDDYEAFFKESKTVKQPLISHSSPMLTQAIKQSPIPTKIDPIFKQQPPVLSEVDLLEKERELQAREEALSQEKLNQPSVTIEKKPNFPICYPILHHDIRGEIKPGWPQAIAYQGLTIMLMICATLFLNVLAAFMTVFSPVTTTGNGISSVYYSVKFIIASFVILLGIPLHAVFCYWSLYSALRSFHAGRFILFFFGYGAGVLFAMFAPLGYYDFGFSGFWLIILYAPPGGNLFAFLINLIMTILWLVIEIGMIGVFIQTIIVFRRENVSIKNITDFVKDTVRTTAVSATTSVVQAGVNQAIQNK